MKALTMNPPLWAWLIIHGPKRIENRTWRTAYRGPLVIHAGSNRTGEADVIAWCHHHGIEVPKLIPAGVALGTIEVCDCVPYDSFAWDGDDPLSLNPFAEGPWCWVLADPKPFANPIACAGAQGLWDFAPP
jgi:hypothetical protein